MGKEWLYWVAGGGRGGGGGGNRSSRRRRITGEVKEATSSGCMCAVFQLFDLHHFQFPLNHQPESFLQEDTPSKGVEAPRNSLELEEPAAMEAASFPLEEKNLKFPAPIQIKTRTSCDSISESSVSPTGTTTPNLVARLMGLDLLPERNSPTVSCSSSSSSNLQKAKSLLHSRKDQIHQSRRSRSSMITFSDDDISINGVRSLPETPRISLARRSDVDHHHRLSLQINKENIGQDFEFSAFKNIATRRGIVQENDQNRSPGHYAKQIVKQVKESFSRRVGLQDVTNAIKNKEQRRDENLLKKPSKILTRIDKENVHQGKKMTPTHNSQKIRFLDSSSKNQSPQAPKVPLQQQQKDFTQKCKEVAGSKIKKHPPQVTDSIRNKKEETFVRSKLTPERVNLVDRKSKKTPLSNELPNISIVPTLLPVKKDPSPPATKLPQSKQSQVSDSHSSKRSAQLSCCSSQSYKQETIFTIQENIQQDKTKGPISSGEYIQYIQRILKRIGITEKPTPIISLNKLQSYPNSGLSLLDPSIFHFLELFHSTTATSTVLSRRCNRKLIFQLVDELLDQIIRPHIHLNAKKQKLQLYGSELIDILCMKIQSFPAANCRVLEDIDALIDTDLCKSQVGGSRAFIEEEGGGIVSEIEREIMDSLVHETITDLQCPYQEERDSRTASEVSHVDLTGGEMLLDSFWRSTCPHQVNKVCGRNEGPHVVK